MVNLLSSTIYSISYKHKHTQNTLNLCHNYGILFNFNTLQKQKRHRNLVAIELRRSFDSEQKQEAAIINLDQLVDIHNLNKKLQCF